jgi:RNA polymerase sigma-70 factor (ECF subfamily)
MPTDEQFQRWCRRIKASDREAFAAVFDALHDPLARYALQITGRTAAAQDIVQYAFTSLWDMREDLDPKQSLEALLFRIVRNRAYNTERDRRTRKAKHDEMKHDNDPVQPDPGARMDADRLEADLRAWMEDLPDRQREALALSRFEGLSHEAIADVMDISPRTVNNHIVEAMKKLRRWVRTHHAEHLTP